MAKPKYFNSKTAGKIPLPIFFPDATKAVIRTLDSRDIENTKTLGVLVNTYHLMRAEKIGIISQMGGVRNFMNFQGGVISDSGGFQIGSLIKKNPRLGRITDKGAAFKFPGEKEVFITPESSIEFQISLGVDMVVALDDFDAPNATKSEAKDSVRRTILWAERSKSEFERICASLPTSHNPPGQRTLRAGGHRPYLLGVIQGGRDKTLRKYCTNELLKIGFDGLGYGGEEKIRGNINGSLAKFLSDLIPDNYFKYALGVGTPADIVAMTKIGWNIFDCVLPTRDARHKRLYIFNADNIENINLNDKNFYSYFTPDKQKYEIDKKPVSTACDCLLCTHYSSAYLYHLFKEKELSALRLSTIHNLRFYSILMEKIREGNQKLVVSN